MMIAHALPVRTELAFAMSFPKFNWLTTVHFKKDSIHRLDLLTQSSHPARIGPFPNLVRRQTRKALPCPMRKLLPPQKLFLKPPRLDQSRMKKRPGGCSAIFQPSLAISRPA